MNPSMEDEFDLGEDFCRLVSEYNKKKKSGGFQSMGLSAPVLKGVMRKGYKIPTPIQRKAIPPILEGKDIVAMARTGSGKTAAFLVPLFQRLKARSGKAGARAIIFSPTRELAQQTMKFAKEIGRFTDLRSAIVLGGDKLDNQFASIHERPDIIVATPGRFLHVVMEMDLKLDAVEYVVFDEADRLFEMGFQDQLQEILHRLSDNRQTLLFSATLPRLLVDFAKAGLNDPLLIRLDTESKLSDKLQTVYLSVRSEDKLSTLLHLVNAMIGRGENVVVFLATKHHVEYVRMVMEQAQLGCSYVYSSLDPAARKIETAKFVAKKTRVLLVTDVAARGIDIPLLDNVINYNFPAKPKLFVHRVGRVARAGRSGTAYSIISSDELAYLIDLHLFLGRPLQVANAINAKSATDGVLGTLPQSLLENEVDQLRLFHEGSPELQSMLGVCNNAYKQYLKSRPVSSAESNKRVKEILSNSISLHPLFKENLGQLGDERNKFLESMRSYRPHHTIFEVGSTAKSQASEVMRVKKAFHQKAIERARNCKNNDKDQEQDLVKSFNLPLADEKDLLEKFPNAKRKYRDVENYLNYQSSDHHTEKGLEIDKSFDRQVAKEVLDLAGDEDHKMRQNKNVTKWDRKKKKYVNETGGLDPKKKKIRTESGAWIPATYKSNAYKDWMEKTKFEQQQEREEEGEEDESSNWNRKFPEVANRKRQKGVLEDRGYKGRGKKPPRKELKSKDEILKARIRRNRLAEHAQRKQGGSVMKKKTKLKRGLK